MGAFRGCQLGDVTVTQGFSQDAKVDREGDSQNLQTKGTLTSAPCATEGMNGIVTADINRSVRVMADPTLAELRADIHRLQLSNEALVQGLILHGDGLAALTEMVTALVQAATGERDGDDAIPQALATLTAAVDRNSTVTERLRETLAGAVVRGASIPDGG